MTIQEKKVQKNKNELKNIFKMIAFNIGNRSLAIGAIFNSE